MSASQNFDVIVVGGGIAGVGVASYLAKQVRVALVESESQLGLHATGRSAALFSEIYGPASIRALSRASRAFFMEPPDGFSAAPLVRPRGVLRIATSDQLDALHRFAAQPDVAALTRLCDHAEALALCPLLRPDYVAAGLREPDAQDLDVDALHQGFLRRLRQLGGRVMVDAQAHTLTYADGVWQVQAGAEVLCAPIVVNAAGAWADVVADRAGVGGLGLEPRRRTATLVEAPPNTDVDALPAVIDIGEQFYFKPDAGLLLLSPADETPTEPCDAQPDEWDIAVAVDRVQQAANLDVRRVRRSWAGLRTFVKDRSPVVGFDPAATGFFWLAGQGGYGIQTAPALSRLAAALVLGQTPPDSTLDPGLDLAALAPERLVSGRLPLGPRGVA